MAGHLTSIVVPAWRSGDPPPVSGLVQSVLRTVASPVEIVVVCNGTDERLVNYLRSCQSVTRFALLNQNAGVARAWNIGAHLALGDYLVFVNEDVLLGPGCVGQLVAALSENPSAGIVGPRGAGWTLDTDHASHVEYVSGKGLVECDAVSGFLFAMPRALLQAVGYFDDELAPCSYEEIDIAQAVRRLGWKAYALGGLSYQHEWGVSVWEPQRRIEWLGRSESLAEITLRNEARLVRKRSDRHHRAFDGSYYDEDYFARTQYVDTMTKPRTISGRIEPPLMVTMADVIQATALLPPRGRLLDVGCSYGFLVAELARRGYDAYGIDFSADAISSSPVRDRVRQGNALEMPLDVRYDLVFVGDLYEHLNDPEARILTSRISAVSDALVAIINRSRHEPSHVNIKSTRQWLEFFAQSGFGLAYAPTIRARLRYLHNSAGTELWHLNLFVLTKRAHSVANRAVARAVGDAGLVWRVAASTRRAWR